MSRQIAPSYDFKFISDQWMTMQDGTRLSVSYWLPEPKATGERFPVVLEVLPYRKDDSHYTHDYLQNAYFARRGIACVRVDIRGTGSSYGKVPDREYSDQELADLPVIIKKLAKQPWSNGNVGMQGISWSAFNSIMTAMQQPANLKGILVAHGSDDLYGNDIHNIDGALHLDIFTLEIDTDNILPRSPDYEINAQYFADRFDQKPWIFTYLQHQRDSSFWHHKRSLQTDFSAIKVPVYAFAGLLDGYRDFAVQMLDHLEAPLKVNIGPQSHAWPDGDPGPKYEWRQLAVRWWQQVLNGKDYGIWKEPRLNVFMRESVPADINLKETPGSYRTEHWPVPGLRILRYQPQKDGSLTETNSEPGFHKLVYQPSTGMGALNWWGETTPDMRQADQASLIYETNILPNDLIILGNPKVKLTVSANAPLAHWVARLEDVNPDGSVSFVTGGLINGAQRETRTSPKAIISNKIFQLNFPMHFTTWKFARGHRIRLSVANAQFPMIWPTPYKMTTKLFVGKGRSEISLPVVPPAQQQPSAYISVERDDPVPDAVDVDRIPLEPFSISRDKQGNTLATAHEGYTGKIRGKIYSSRYKVTYSVNEKNPACAAFTGEGEDTVQTSDNRLIKVHSTIQIQSDLKYFHVKVVRNIFSNRNLIRSRTWKEKILRDFE